MNKEKINKTKIGDYIILKNEPDIQIAIVNSKVLGNIIINGVTLDEFEQERIKELNEKL